MKMSAVELPAQDKSLYHTSYCCNIACERGIMYYFLPTCLPNKIKMYLESGDSRQQTIISCGNELTRVSNKSPQTDSLTYEFFVSRVQTRRILLSRNTPAEK